MDELAARLRDDRGAPSLEFGGILPIALFCIFLVYQAYISSTTVERVENIARTGAREASKLYSPGQCREYALGAKPYWINDYQVEGGHTRLADGDAVYCEVDAKLPIIWKGIPLDYTVTRKVTLPLG
ncbi:TadE/TadG family type IV pilus assembly protein [Actinomadura hibisca]|uniref:TadE/TadG family type IV pilus assembly protein n=1 Tax=Actinomadura hibisca TaxID=68565 RepID=UPI0008375C3F|nr:pilus assembly protein [Actinomadura hibisca]